MKYTVKTSALHTLSTQCLVLGVYENNTLPSSTTVIDKVTRKAISKKIKAGDITGKLGQTLLLHDLDGVNAKRVLLTGFGKKSAFKIPRH